MKNKKLLFPALILLIAATSLHCTSKNTPSVPQYFIGNIEQLLINKPENGYVSNMPAYILLTGNETLGALVIGVL